MTLGLWVDANVPLSGAVVQGAGIVGVKRYVGIGSGSKRLTVGERDDLLGHGRPVFGIAESTATEADGGAPAGTRDAEAVLADPAADGLPFVYLTNDKPGFITADVDYAAAFTDVLGVRSAVYGFAAFLKALWAAGIPVSVNWQAGLPPNVTGTQGRVHFWQRQGSPGNGSDGPATPTTILLGGHVADLNNQLLEVPMTTPADIWGYSIPSPDGKTTFAALDWLRYGDTYAAQSAANTQAILTQLAAIPGAIAKEEADLIGAIKALPAPVVQQITTDPTAVAAALESAGLPAQIISALMALLAKAASTGGVA
jgi:hypothetical protein